MKSAAIPVKLHYVIIAIRMKRFFLTATAASLVLLAASVRADQVLVLKNGRQITVQSYREEGGMIKFHGYGGEIGISKEQILTIRDSAAREAKGLDVSVPAAAPPAPPRAAAKETRPTKPAPPREAAKLSPPTQPAPTEKPPSAEEERAKEEKQYQEKLREMTERLREARERYAQATRGTADSEPKFLTTSDEIKRINEDARARSLDSVTNPVDPGKIRLLTPSPFSSLPPSVIEYSLTPSPQPSSPYDPRATYTDRERELSNLRNQTLQLEQERNRLIEEIRQKNFNTGALFLE